MFDSLFSEIFFAVPPDLFLLGCIFVVVELESFLEERIPGWQQKIEKHGGKLLLYDFNILDENIK